MNYEKPDWHTEKDDSAWERTKNAFKNDWEQTKHDFGSDKARDLNQDVDDTVKQAADADNAFENREQAFRFGQAARREFGPKHAQWNDKLEIRLREDYSGNFDKDRNHIRHSYNYQNKA